MKVVDLDKLTREIKDWHQDIHDNEYNAHKFDFVFERIYEILADTKQLNSWVACNDELPRTGSKVFVKMLSGAAEIGYKKSDAWEINGIYYSESEVVAWQPLNLLADE